MATTELCALYPSLKAADIVRMKIIHEREATFAPSPGMERFRPRVEATPHGFFLAGDWTDTGLPATIEGAVRSGEHAAAAVHAFLQAT